MTQRDKTQGLLELSQLMGSNDIELSLSKISQQILRDYPDLSRLLLIGIRTGGVYLAKRLQKLLEEKANCNIPLGVMDISLYRDDVFGGLARPEVGPTEIDSSLEGQTVVLVDDVLYTGRTIRSALVELMDYGRPDNVRLAVLVDRGHRELPIQPDYVGASVKTNHDQTILVFLRELGQADRVALFGKRAAGR